MIHMLKVRSVLVRFLFLHIIFFSVFLADASAQGSFSSSQLGETSVYAATGITKLYGDIGGYVAEKFALVDINTSLAVGFRYTTPFRIGFSFLTEINNHYQGDDKGTHLNYRQMAFKSRQWGYSGQLEITLLGGSYMKDFNPNNIYMFGGGGYSYAKARFLNPDLIRSSDKVKYKEQSPCIYGGFGYQYRLNDQFSLGAEYRATQFFSDFIDGYHPKFSKRDDMSMDFRVIAAYYFEINLSRRKKWDCHCDY
ncbi:exported hypothetical protein [uncultured Paludibacter sp.]|uniref:Uncharacterized protein n=1 Tax=uncultured Paludibacter sp. TaxID=497635 RepID=A0A653AG34_9BACT|nr:exported hypothetical protein [uncultured Paludibacter sp.]